MSVIRNCLVFFCIIFANAAIADTDVNVVGLFTGKAIVIINKGKPQTLSVGQTSSGVKLISANSEKAVLDIEGKRKELGMGQAATVAGGAVSVAQSAVLYADSAGHYITEGYINGRSLKMLVDTGATSVAMNSGDAKYAGVEYKYGEKGQVSTASGLATAYRVTFSSVKIGNLTLNNVDGMVIEGGYPDVVLYGMTALNRLDMKRDGMTLTLTKRY